MVIWLAVLRYRHVAPALVGLPEASSRIFARVRTHARGRDRCASWKPTNAQRLTGRQQRYCEEDGIGVGVDRLTHLRKPVSYVLASAPQTAIGVEACYFSGDLFCTDPAIGERPSASGAACTKRYRASQYDHPMHSNVMVFYRRPRSKRTMLRALQRRGAGPLRILVADDHDVIRSGLRRLLSGRLVLNAIRNGLVEA